MTKNAAIIAWFLLMTIASFGQTDNSTYTLTVNPSGGYVRNFSDFDPPLAGLERNGLAGNIRVMWKPEYLLSAGLEVGYTHTYSINQDQVQTEYGTTDIRASNNAWPILIVFSMSPFMNLEINLGLGTAISTATIESFGHTSSSSEIGSTYMGSVAYLLPLSKNLRLGGEIRYMRINKFEDNNMTLLVTLAYKFLEW